MNIESRQVICLFDQDMAGPSQFILPAGETAACSMRAINKPGPNEDGALLALFDSQTAVLAVADGMGGSPAGEVAAQTALRALAEALNAAAESQREPRDAILNGFEQANQATLALGAGAGATLAVAEIQNSTVRPYHVGDSPILLIGQRGRIRWQTISHSPVGYALESGLLQETEALNHGERHIISNFVGMPEMRIDIGPPLRLRPRDTLLLATDGLCDNLRLEELTNFIRKGPLMKGADAMGALARRRMAEPGENEPTKPDDLTYLVYRPRRTTPS